MKHWPFLVVNEGGKPKIRVEYKSETKTFFPEEISSMVLNKMKEIAEAYLGKVFVSLLERLPLNTALMLLVGHQEENLAYKVANSGVGMVIYLWTRCI